MKRFLGYLYDCRYMWIWFILSGGAFVLCFALYEVELKAAVYPVLLSAVFGILFFVLGYLRREKKYKRLFQISEMCIRDSSSTEKWNRIEEKTSHRKWGVFFICENHLL